MPSDAGSIPATSINLFVVMEQMMQRQKIPKKVKVSRRKKMRAAACSVEMQAHIQRLGLSSVKAYKKWCRQHDFSRCLNKTLRQRRKEIDYVCGIKAMERLQAKKRDPSLLARVVPMIGALAKHYTAEWSAMKASYDAAWYEVWAHHEHEKGRFGQKKRYRAARSAINARQDAALNQLTARHEAARDALKARYKREALKAVKSLDVKLGQSALEVVTEVINAFVRSSEIDLFRDCLLHLESASNLLRGALYIDYIRELADDCEQWVRPIQEWHPKSSRPSRQFSELLRYLYAARSYPPIPLFMDTAWKNSGQRELFHHVAAGENVRTAEYWPVPPTRKMAYYFLMVPMPAGSAIEKAFVCAQVRSILGGGGRQLVNILWKKFGTDAEGGLENWARFVRDNGFWLNVIRFLGAHPKLEANQVDLIVDYVHSQKYEARADTDFSMKGRTVEALLRRAETWQRDIEGLAALERVQWQPSGIGEFDFRDVDTGSGSQRYWAIREVCSTHELVQAGRVLLNCLSDVSRFNENFSYAKRCYTGELSIWTLEARENTSSRKVLMIAVSLKEGIPEIIEVSGRKNRGPTDAEVRIVDRWAAEEDLKCNYVIYGA